MESFYICLNPCVNPVISVASMLAGPQIENHNSVRTGNRNSFYLYKNARCLGFTLMKYDSNAILSMKEGLGEDEFEADNRKDTGSENDDDLLNGDEALFASIDENKSTKSNNQKKEESVVDFDDLSWRMNKLRLEEANTRRFLKAGPRFLPYNECRKWVKAWNRWETEEEWKGWIDEGEKRNSYIPARPDEYYGKLGQWKGWDHFLGVSDDNVDD